MGSGGHIKALTKSEKDYEGLQMQAIIYSDSKTQAWAAKGVLKWADEFRGKKSQGGDGVDQGCRGELGAWVPNHRVSGCLVVE